MKKIIEGNLFNRIEKLGNKKYKHIGFEDDEGKFGDYLEEIVPTVGMIKRARLTIETLENNVDQMLNKEYVYAVIGASKNQEKYGYKVLKDLKDFGYNVIPINLKEKEILNLKTYKSILDVDQKIDVAIFVVSPLVTIEVLRQVKKKKINKVWLQPGSESKEAIDYCKKNKILCIANLCIMLNKKLIIN